VSTDGMLYPCSKFIGYEGSDAGNVQLGSLEEGITNIALRKNLAHIGEADFLDCGRCKLKENCEGGCPADNFFLNRKLHEPGTTHCKLKYAEQRVLKDLRQDLNTLNRNKQKH
jgi:uncharacterized protein